jgi:catechol 2,3-dioxygenase-like lactoylglutathione lyase family enzyme
MAIKKIEMSWIVVSDLERSQKFFVDTLGLKLDNFAPEYNWLEVSTPEGDCALGIGADSSMQIKNAVLTFTVDDIVASKKELESKGVKFAGGIEEVPGHVKMATFHDPDGNMFQLVEKLN